MPPTMTTGTAGPIDTGARETLHRAPSDGSDGPKRIVVRLPNWLGDTVMAVPALRSLRAAFPRATFIAAGPWASMLAGQELVDVIVTYPRSWRGRLRMADVVRQHHACLALVLPNSLESALAAWYWGATRRIGFAVGARAALLTEAPPLPSPRLHQVDEYLALVSAVGASALAAVPDLTPPARESESRATVRELLQGAGVDRRHASVIGIHLGAMYGSSKLWSTERMIELVKALGRDGDVPVLLGPAASEAAASEIVDATGASSVVGRDTPELLAALLTEVDVLVGGDTGVTHLAAALGTPVVALFGPTDPALSAPRGRVVVVRHPVPCSPCFYRACPIDHPCMREITTDHVRQAVHAVRETANDARDERGP
jgi:lipopolysaccharide heptosyltransferase II